MALAMVWRWMKRDLAPIRPVHDRLVVGGHFDVVAEHVVVPDFQRADAGFLDQVALHAGDHPARLVAQRPHLVELAVIVARTNPPSRFISGSSSASARSRCWNRSAGSAAMASRAAAELGRQHLARRAACRSRRPPQARPQAPRSRGPPRFSASRDSARAMSGAVFRLAAARRQICGIGTRRRRPRPAFGRSPWGWSAAPSAARPAAVHRRR